MTEKEKPLTLLLVDVAIHKETVAEQMPRWADSLRGLRT